MSSIDDIRKVRIEKLNSLKEAGLNPYPIESNQDYTLSEVTENFDKLSKTKKTISIVGRVLSLRPQGAIIFLNINDGTGIFQGLLKKGEGIADKLFELFNNVVDTGDFVEITGTLFTTKRGEKTLQVENWRMLAKSLRPLPEKWHGLQDVEERFRRRYLDILMNGEVKNRFQVRSKIISEIRKIFDNEGFLEVETPMLQSLPGGASALPFETHHNALEMDMYLRIAPELFLKRLLVGGFSKVYEIGKNFRNEGIDVTHHPEFTMLEYYEAYSNASNQMKFIEKFLKTIVKKITGKTTIQFEKNDIDFGKKFSVVTYFDLLKRMTLIPDPNAITLEELKLKASQLGVKVDPGDSMEKIFDNIYKKACRPKIIEPTFITDYPADYLPLAKRSTQNSKSVDAFQLIISGLEVVKAFSELNDPIDQKERFQNQEKNKEAGDKEAQISDTDYLEAMEYGMPPAGGVGIGIDRLVMLLTNTSNIREVILFPTLRPRI